MLKVGLFCAAGMSTSMLVEKMKVAAKERGMEVEIAAYPESEMEKYVDHIDVALLGPQVKYLLNKGKAVCEPKGVAIDVINTVDYGMMNGSKVLDHAIKLSK
ncbi:PTS system cellobiose-specific IIB component [Bacillus ectoiniformans]|uniref:PTS sugar transporter subunit IIB n=1 Tax=Bacillus ectoiniformans TaxID=1494429 RepID=UPI00195E4D70|nr:PTS sugar transporter subunit IIB [Bacillus ectoiniformans]MBM7650410.1 PTS system cellobiose-specific IIB component [Bacillus ectoiniformans]